MPLQISSRRLWTALLALLLLTHTSMAQNQSGRRQAGSLPVELHGTIHVAYDAFFHGQSLKDLVKAADVIVYGRIDSIFPGRLRHADEPASVETDALIAIDRVLKGKADVLRSLVISQMGGKYADGEIIVDGCPLLKERDRHVLFLNYDRRGIAPTYPRTDGSFYIVAGSVGNFKVEGNAVSSSNGGVFSQFNSESLEDFMRQILTEVGAAR
jgi:hypothetical protein